MASIHRAAFMSLAFVLISSAAHAVLSISTKPTKNMDCSAGECIATAANAVMNVDDLAAMLASSDMRVVADPLVGQDMVVSAPFAWATSHSLTLETADAMFIRNTIAVEGTAHLELKVAGGPYFQEKGSVRFWDTASQLTIDGQDYRLVNSITTLAATVAAHPKGFIALASDYNAKPDGQYTRVPVQTDFAGTFEGLGNTISNFSIWDTTDNLIALFATTKNKAIIRDLGMAKVNVLAENSFTNLAGGLVGENDGMIVNCHIDGGTVRTDFDGALGGLTGVSYGNVFRSWANVSVEGAQSAQAGGLIGNAHGHVQDVYATGRVIAGDQSDVGGLIGYNFGHVRDAYSTGQVSGGQNARVGGLMGTTQLPVHNTYWDIETSGTQFGVSGTNIDGITGLTTAEFKAGLPPGFSFETWAESAKNNDGYPYLLANPPQ
jgi:The GLUG motif